MKAIPRLDRLPDPQRRVCLSAAKMVQEGVAISAIDINQCLTALDHIEPPNREDPRGITRCYHNIRSIYSGKSELGKADFGKLWRGVGLGADTIWEMLTELEALSADPEACAIIRGVLPDLLSCSH